VAPDPPRVELIDPERAVDGPLWWALRESAQLAGTRLPGADFDFDEASARGLTHLVSLTGTVTTDCSPLIGSAFDLEDLYERDGPSDPTHELRRVGEAAEAVRSLVAQGHGVLVHCLGGTGRTGTVVGAVLVSLGHPVDDVAQWLDQIHKQRGQAGWPESPWQRTALDVLG